MDYRAVLMKNYHHLRAEKQKEISRVLNQYSLYFYPYDMLISNINDSP